MPLPYSSLMHPNSPTFVLRLATAALVALAPLSAAQAPPPAHGVGVGAGAVPRYESAPCPVDVEPGERIDCGALFVPENRARPESRTLRLPVMIFRSRGATPAPDPLLFLSGGPGNSTVANRRSGKGNPFLDERDYILLEQRGARYAEPALLCPEMDRLEGEIATGKLRGRRRRPHESPPRPPVAGRSSHRESISTATRRRPRPTTSKTCGWRWGCAAGISTASPTAPG